MKNTIIGTAGHVDHGKTTLIKALTGTDTDRLKEEKERGMTIDLGFASLTLPNGRPVGVVDVPGHERFIRNMLAGAGGVDVALLVVAADESVMPQTVEHLEILQLLEVKRGVVALTKADMVDSDWIEYVRDDVHQSLDGTFLAGSQVIPVASTTGVGIPELMNALQEACESVEERDTAGPFRMPVDRIFTLTGFGTVITGTLISGTVKVGDPVEVMPSGLQTRVRQLQVFGHKVETASAGMRVAMNLAGVEVSDVERGDICATPGTVKASTSLDLKLTLLDNSPRTLKNRARVRLHVGTAELIGRVVLLDRDEIKPGEEAFVQFKSESPAAAARNDRFVIRSYSPMVTIGGGTVVDPTARKHRRFDETTLIGLETSSRGTPEELLDQAVKNAAAVTTASELAKSTGLSDVPGLLAGLVEGGRVVELGGGRLLHSSVYSTLCDKVGEALNGFIAKNPLRPGMPREELRVTAAKAFDSRAFAALLARMESDGLVSSTDTLVSPEGYKVSLTPEQQRAAEKLSGELLRSGFNVLSQDDLLQVAGIRPSEGKELLELLIHRNEVVRVMDDLYFHSETLKKAEELLREHIGGHGSITVSQFRDLTGSSRKYALPILEYFDSKRITRRVGDERVLGAAR